MLGFFEFVLFRYRKELKVYNMVFNGLLICKRVETNKFSSGIDKMIINRNAFRVVIWKHWKATIKQIEALAQLKIDREVAKGLT